MVNIRSALLGTAAIFTLSPAYAADAQCVSVIRSDSSYPAVNFEMRKQVKTPNLDRSYNRAQLARRAGPEIYKGPHTQVNGLTVANLTTSVSGSFQIYTLHNKTRCVWPQEIILNTGYSKLDVLIASEFPLGSCQYDVTLEHELHHVRINQEYLDRYLPVARREIENSILQVFPMRLGPGGDPSEIALSEVSRIVDSQLARMTRDRDHAHAELDSPESYEYWQSLCPSW